MFHIYVAQEKYMYYPGSATAKDGSHNTIHSWPPVVKVGKIYSENYILYGNIENNSKNIFGLLDFWNLAYP
jgi:hypothetical protein